MKDKTIISNKLYFQRKIRKNLDTFNTFSQIQGSSGKPNQKKAHSGEETPMNLENEYSEINQNALEENDEKASHHNFDVSQKYDEITEYNELNDQFKLPIIKKNTFRINDNSSPKSCISEPMNKRLSIALKAEQEENQDHSILIHDQENTIQRKKRFTKSRTGIDQPSPPKKTLSGTSSFMIGETFVRNADNEEI